MFRTLLMSAAVAAALTFPSMSGQAHHAVQAQFDVATELTVKAKLVQIDWVNPHAWWHWDVIQPDGSTTRLSTETPGPTGLRRIGLSDRRMWQIGAEYEVKYNPDRNPAQALGFTTSIKLPDGRLIVLGFDQL